MAKHRISRRSYSDGPQTQYAYYLVMTGFGLPWPEAAICLPAEGQPEVPADPETSAPVESTTEGSVSHAN